MDSPVINTISLCTGIGMLDEAFRLGCDYFGWRTSPAMCCEWEGYAASCLMARMEESSVEPAPIWCGDLQDLDFSQFCGGVDAFLAGFPCQPFSVAGQQRGHEDERNIWDDIIRAITQTEPTIILLENVPGLASTSTIHHRPDLLAHLAALDSAIESATNGRDKWQCGSHRRRLYQRLLREQGVSALLYVKASLEALDYIVEDPIFVTAESVGASHRRERVFVLAIRKGRRFRELWESSRGHGFTHGSGEELADDSALQRGAIKRSEQDGTAGTVDDASRKRRSENAGSSSSDEATHGRAGRDGGEPHGDNQSECVDATLDDTAGPRSARQRQRGKQSEAARDREQAGLPRSDERHSNTLDDTDGSRPRKPGQSGQRQREQQPGRPSESSGRCEPVEYTTGECQRESPNDTDAKPATRNSRDESGDGSIKPVGSPTGCSGRLDQPGRGSDQRAAAGRTERDGGEPAFGVGQANSECSRSQGDGPAEPQRRDIAIARDTDRPIFAPGPGADWASIPEHLWPAVEPGFRLLVDGVAVVLDQGRVDQLRCGGNGVVAICAAVAFVELMRRAKARD